MEPADLPLGVSIVAAKVPTDMAAAAAAPEASGFANMEIANVDCAAEEPANMEARCVVCNS